MIRHRQHTYLLAVESEFQVQLHGSPLKPHTLIPFPKLFSQLFSKAILKHLCHHLKCSFILIRVSSILLQKVHYQISVALSIILKPWNSATITQSNDKPKDPHAEAVLEKSVAVVYALKIICYYQSNNFPIQPLKIQVYCFLLIVKN